MQQIFVRVIFSNLVAKIVRSLPQIFTPLANPGSHATRFRMTIISEQQGEERPGGRVFFFS
jgi:hypothetical protein